jgi:hypothetical protein
VFPSGNGIYQVEIPDTGFKYIVNLTKELCTCKDFYEYQGPCTHAIAASRHHGNDPLALFVTAILLSAFGIHTRTQLFLYQSMIYSQTLQFYLHLYENNLGDHTQNDIAKGSSQGSRNNVAIA